MSPALVNMLMPMLVLLSASILLPAVLVPRRTLSQRHLAFGVMVSAAILLLLGALVFAWLYAQAGAQVFAAVAEEPFGVVGHLLGVSLRALPFWAPVLGLVWLARAQGVERRKGEVLAERTRRGVAQDKADP